MDEADRLDDEQFVRTAYRLVLQRDADAGGLQHWTGFLADGGWRKRVIAAMASGEEFHTLGTEPLHARLHRARQAWIATLPAADDILDIGGSSPTNPLGALRDLGWTGTPKRLTIVDLPPDDQYHGRPVYSQADPFVTPWGGEVVYLHSPAEDLAGSDVFEGHLLDAVFMGQAIEHIRVEAVPRLFRWIRAHLRDGGWFALDTPNRAVTRLQCPDSFIDPDHTVEYVVPHMRQLLEDAGFTITSTAGILPFPGSVQRSVWDPEETYDLPLVDDDAASGYAMGIVARA